MSFSFDFFLNSILLGVGLAMDAFSVSIANSLAEPFMKKGRMCCIAGVYAFFQFAMPMAGWICVHTIVEYFKSIQKFIPWIALILLLYIGGKMLLESIREIREAKESGDAEAGKDARSLTFGVLMFQGIATAIDALSVGFTISDYNTVIALIASLIIAAVTFVICMGGLVIGKKVGSAVGQKAGLLGGCILIFIGLEIFVKGVL